MGTTFLGIIAGLATGLATMIGALPILKNRTNSWSPWKNLNLDFAIGMMLAAAAFNLIGPAYQNSSQKELQVTFALVLGIVSIYSLSHLIHFFSPKEWSVHRRAWMFVTAMMLHNLPEGLASGAAVTAPGLSHSGGWTVVGAIIFQNFPEGLATAAAFLSIGMSKRKAFAGACLTGVMEILGGTAGGVFASATTTTLPYILAFAGGAMISVTLEEVTAKIKDMTFKYLLKKDFQMGVLSVLLVNWLTN